MLRYARLGYLRYVTLQVAHERLVDTRIIFKAFHIKSIPAVVFVEKLLLHSISGYLHLRQLLNVNGMTGIALLRFINSR